MLAMQKHEITKDLLPEEHFSEIRYQNICQYLYEIYLSTQFPYKLFLLKKSSFT